MNRFDVIKLNLDLGPRSLGVKLCKGWLMQRFFILFTFYSKKGFFLNL